MTDKPLWNDMHSAPFRQVMHYLPGWSPVLEQPEPMPFATAKPQPRATLHLTDDREGDRFQAGHPSPVLCGEQPPAGGGTDWPAQSSGWGQADCPECIGVVQAAIGRKVDPDAEGGVSLAEATDLMGALHLSGRWRDADGNWTDHS